MLKVYDGMLSATYKLIKQTHVRHEKKILRLEKEIRKKNELNLIMQQVLIKILMDYWNIFDVPNNKFDEILSILSSLFDHLKAQAPTVATYDALSKQINVSFKKVLERLFEVNETARLSSEAGTFDTIWGEGPSRKSQTITWKSASEFSLRY